MELTNNQIENISDNINNVSEYYENENYCKQICCCLPKKKINYNKFFIKMNELSMNNKDTDKESFINNNLDDESFINNNNLTRETFIDKNNLNIEIQKNLNTTV